MLKFSASMSDPAAQKHDDILPKEVICYSIVNNSKTAPNTNVAITVVWNNGGTRE